MNQKNLEFLASQVRYTGFGEALEPAMRKKMEKGEKEFSLSHEAKFEKSSLSSELHFKKSDQSDLYFFNSYKATLLQEGEPHKLEQVFYVGKDNTFTMKEAFNLLEGRSVHKDLVSKEGEQYNAWVKMDFKNGPEESGNFKMNHYHQNYGYDLEAALSMLPIKELQTPAFKENLMASLKKGNNQSVTFVVGAEEKKHFIEANPQFKTISVYDAHMQRISMREGREEKQKQDQGMIKGQKNETGDDGDAEQKARKDKKKSQSL